jgi:hypothetical protein
MTVIIYFLAGGFVLALMPGRWALWVLATCGLAALLSALSMGAEAFAYLLHMAIFTMPLAGCGFVFGLIAKSRARELHP